MALFAILLTISQGVPAFAEDAKAKADVVGEASSPSHKSPIHVKVVDYQKADDGPGTLKMSGRAIPGQDVHIVVDGKPFATVMAAKDDGAWSVEDKIALDDTVHSVRVQQIDETTQMPAATAMFSMSLSPPSPEQLAAPPAGRH